MKIKFVKNYLTFKANEVHEVGEEAAELIAKGIAEEVKEDKLDATVAELEKRVSEVAEKVAAEAANKTVEKINKAFAAKKSSIFVGADRSEEDPKRGFKHYGEFAMAVFKAGTHQGVDKRLEALDIKAVAGQSETDADGGYLIPQIWANEVFNDMTASNSLLPRTRQFQMSVGDILHVPVSNKNTIGGGIAASWKAEAIQMSVTKGALTELQLAPYKLTVLVATTDELQRDTALLNSYLEGEVSYAIDYKVSNGIVRGVGTTEMTGFLGHAGSVLQLRTTANLITFADVVKMRSRFTGNLNTAVWLANPETYPQLATMTNGNYPVYIANQSLAGAPLETLNGLPIIYSEHMSTLGVEGDIALVDLSKYYVAIKGGVEAASSIHVYFDTAQQAFRYILRLDGKPARATVITPATGQGTKTLGHFVVLDDATT